MARTDITLPMHSANPAEVVVERNGALESKHLVDVVVVDAEGTVILGLGDVERNIFPRSAMKPLQAIALIEVLNEADHGALSDDEISLICASHNAENIHVEAVLGLMEKFDLNPDTLTCGAHWSIDQATSIKQARMMDMPTKAHNNCSGKHAGMVILATVMGARAEGYAKLSHPVQQRILGVLEHMTGADLMQYPHGVDGCGAPALSGPMGNWARGFAVFADPSHVSASREKAIGMIRDAIAAKPEMMAGTGRACSAVNAAYGHDMTVKVGAEGVYGAAFHNLGLGMMLKARDGNKRGAEAALGAIIHALGYDEHEALKIFFDPIQRNWAGEETGQISTKLYQ